jgi:hypothetical protein
MVVAVSLGFVSGALFVRARRPVQLDHRHRHEEDAT